MLQQTQVTTVIGYYERFLQRFPTVEVLAAAPLSEVMPLWAGLGYYARARNLHACAQQVVLHHGGQFPSEVEALNDLPGIGRSTAAAIAAFCFNKRAAILDGNVKRVLARHFLVDGVPASAPVERQLWGLAETLLPPNTQAMPAYTQALMDLGATICTRSRPQCQRCPVQSSCGAFQANRVNELPMRPTRKATPLKHAHWLIAIYKQQVWLEQRPPTGIWGGLLVPPQFADGQGLQQALAPLNGQSVTLQSRVHAFTHYTLHYTPHLVELEEKPLRVEDSSGQWLSLQVLEQAALPTPVRSLLLELRDSAPLLQSVSV